MKRFPEEYSRPELVSVQNGYRLGWSARCRTGGSPGTAQPVCLVGDGVASSEPARDFLNDTGYTQNSGRSSGLFSDR